MQSDERPAAKVGEGSTKVPDLGRRTSAVSRQLERWYVPFLQWLRADSLLPELGGAAGQAFDPLGDWRMGRKQAAEVHPQERLDDEQVRG